MNYTLKQINSPGEWKPENLSDNVHITQSFYYHLWQKEFGNESYALAFYKNDKAIAYSVFVICPLFGRIKYAIAPYGPVLSKEFVMQDAVRLNKELKKFFLNKNIAFVRYDFEPPNLTFEFPGFDSFWFTQQGACMQPRREWFVDLEKDEKELLSQMHQKTRYNVRLAERKGIEVDIIYKDMMSYFDFFYNVLKDTSKRNNYTLHDKKYYELAFKYAEKNNGFLVIAKKDDEQLVANLILTYNKMAFFAYGGSINKYRNLMPNYLAHWYSIKEAKKNGYKYYSFGGYFDENGPRLRKKTLKSRGKFSIFKRKFGGFVYEHRNFTDYILNYPIYIVWNIYKLIKHP